MKFTINSEEWEMTEVDSCAIELVGEERPNLGVCAFNTNKIFIRKELPPSKKPVVVRHELAHAFLNSTQLGYKDKYEDEELCEFVGKYADKISEIAERFIKEVEVTSDILPAIRQHGVYATEELLANPGVLIEALQALKKERARE